MLIAAAIKVKDGRLIKILYESAKKNQLPEIRIILQLASIMKQVEIITIGDELLIGQVVDTNSAWMAQRLNEAGIKVKQITSVSDDSQHIINALNEDKQRPDIILITGGLGPTNDDITKYTLCKYFKSNLRFDEKAFLNVERIFKARGKEVTEVNRKQAEVPEKCDVLPNANGTAPGMWFDVKDKIYVSMPGVPHEMKPMMENHVLPELKARFSEAKIFHRTILTQGAGESFLAEKISDWEKSLPKHIRLAYLPTPGTVRLRLSTEGTDDAEKLKEEVDELVKRLHPLAGEFIYGYDDDTLEKIIGDLLRNKKATLSTAESCTGGYIAHRITTMPGSSDYYIGSVVAYANRIKETHLDVSHDTIDKHGAVSEEAVKEMARGIKEKFKTDYSIAVSGIAGPDGGTAEKPVGTVWFAIAYKNAVFTKKLSLGNNRQRVIIETSLHALNNLRKILLQS
jgi:nicotinamide-nucleotide amidase